jgi:hypothetical protein
VAGRLRLVPPRRKQAKPFAGVTNFHRKMPVLTTSLTAVVIAMSGQSVVVQNPDIAKPLGSMLSTEAFTLFSAFFLSDHLIQSCNLFVDPALDVCIHLGCSSSLELGALLTKMLARRSPP